MTTPDLTKKWTPDAASRLAVLRSSLEKPDTDSVEIEIPGTPVTCHLGTESGGSIWIRIACDPNSVSNDDRAASITFAITLSGYKITVLPDAPETVICHLFDEMIQLLKDGYSPGDVGRAALQNWRDLLARPPGGVLSDNALVGLFGELEVLETLLHQGGNIDYWTGWNRDHQDFRIPGLTIEVKTTTSANYRRVRIHGLGQLADPEDGSDLILILKRLEPSPVGRSVPEIVDSIVQTGASRAVLLDRLSRVGYFEQHRASYSNRKFFSSEVALRTIDASHPRLVPSMLSAVDLSSIDKIDYELNLNGDADADVSEPLEDVLSRYLEAR
jgi:hypothetical protein